MQAAFFASICHDVDHQARTNAFLRKHTSRLGSLYPTGSLMEQHHFNYAMNIIQSEGHNIFAHLPLNIYKQVSNVPLGQPSNWQETGSSKIPNGLNKLFFRELEI